MKNKKPDRIFSEPLNEMVDFRFDEQVARVFPDMIQRSVPGYASIISMLNVMSDQFTQPHSNCYDLGCSLGAATLAMRHGIRKEGCRIIAVDNSPAMIDRCRTYIKEDTGVIPIKLIHDDIRNVKINNASLVVLNFTLQFIDPADRMDLISNIYSGMLPGGALIISEKLKFDDGDEQDFQTDMHLHYKRINGYSELEISQKRSALENVLFPETWPDHRDRILNAGFVQCYLWFQCFNFMSYIAVK